jgi:hypothetical protein
MIRGATYFSFPFTGGELTSSSVFKTGPSANSKIGELIIILPGRHEGGKLQLRHAGQVKSIDPAYQSQRMTSIVAAYSGVKHAQSSIVSGHRLSLIYDIVYTPKNGEDRLGLPHMDAVHRRLHNILRSWKGSTGDSVPKFLACLLQHQYLKIPNFSSESLTGGDALLLSHLRPLARDLEFRLLLAHIEFTISITARADPNDDEEDEYGGYGYDDENHYDEEDFEDDGEAHEDVGVRQVVGLSGIPVALYVDIQPEDLLNGSIMQYDADDHIFGREDRTVSRSSRTFSDRAHSLVRSGSDAYHQ